MRVHAGLFWKAVRELSLPPTSLMGRAAGLPEDTSARQSQAREAGM